MRFSLVYIAVIMIGTCSMATAADTSTVARRSAGVWYTLTMCANSYDADDVLTQRCAAIANVIGLVTADSERLRASAQELQAALTALKGRAGEASAVSVQREQLITVALQTLLGRMSPGGRAAYLRYIDK